MFEQYLKVCQERVEAALEQLLPQAKTQPERLHAAMRHATLGGGGKRVRPVLVYAAGAALGVDTAILDRPASAVELIHTYSLVHDDLPAMDNDDLRRGIPTCHRAFDEATAILAGDALQTLAFKILAHSSAPFPAEIRIEMINALAIASGSRGMAGGQALDLAAIGQELSLAQLENMHIHKTGALIRASVGLGTLAATDADAEQVRSLDHYAKCIGLAFQVRDDILDVEGNTETLGKTQGKDQAGLKPTYPSLLGLTASREMAHRLRLEALESLESLDGKADPLRSLANYIIDRSH